MSLVDTPKEQRRSIAKARKVKRARDMLEAVLTDEYDAQAQAWAAFCDAAEDFGRHGGKRRLQRREKLGALVL